MAIIPLKNYPNMAINQKWTSKSIFNHPSTYMHPSIHPSSIHGLHTLITKLKNLAIFTFFFPSHLAIETLGSRLFHFLISGFFNFAFWRNFASKNKTLTRMSRVGQGRFAYNGAAFTIPLLAGVLVASPVSTSSCFLYICISSFSLRHCLSFSSSVSFASCVL